MAQSIKKSGIPSGAENIERLPASARVDLPVLQALTSKSRATIYRWIDQGILPRPIKTRGTQNAWNVGEIRAALGITSQSCLKDAA